MIIAVPQHRALCSSTHMRAPGSAAVSTFTTQVYRAKGDHEMLHSRQRDDITGVSIRSRQRALDVGHVRAVHGWWRLRVRLQPHSAVSTSWNPAPTPLGWPTRKRGRRHRFPRQGWGTAERSLPRSHCRGGPALRLQDSHMQLQVRTGSERKHDGDSRQWDKH